MKVKRFVVFAFNQYYPRGGWYDHKDSFDTLEEAIGKADALTKQRDIPCYRGDYEEAQIVDLETGEYI